MIYSKTKAKSILADKDKLNKLVTETLDDMATIVSATLGPSGRCVLIEREDMAPMLSKDGYTVVKSLGLADAQANVIIEAAKEISVNTAKEAGDGTTTAIVLANAIVKAGQKFLVENPKYNPQRLVRELKKCYSEIVIPYLQDLALRVDNDETLFSVARISANGDEDIAKVVVEAVLAAGEDGTVLIEEAQGRDMRVENLEGYIVTTGLKEHGQIGTIFINDKGNQQVKLDYGLVFLYDGSMNDLKVPAKIQELLADDQGSYDGTPIIIFAHDFSDPVIDKFAKSVKTGVMVIPVKTPRSGIPNGSSMFLHDMAAYTGATVQDITTLDSVDDEAFGSFTAFKMNMYETLISSDPISELIEARLEELRAIEKAAPSEFDRAFLKAAIGKLTGGIATIMVGGVSDLEVREKKARVEDAVEAVRSAIAEGVIPGGCTVHIKLAKLIECELAKNPSWEILSKALMEPFITLMGNCGEDYQEILAGLDTSATRKLPEIVFDANDHITADPFIAGIIEPAKVCRVALGNALSIASMLITIGGIVVVPRDAQSELQMDMANQAFKNMMASQE